MKLNTLALLFVPLLLSGCVHAYIDPQYRSATFKDIQYTNQPPVVSVTAEFQMNGSHWPSQDKDLREHVVRFLKATKVFDPAENTNTPTVGKLAITLNDTGSLGAAFGKGFVTGLTYGLVGSEVEDHYIMTARYTPVWGAAFTNSYHYLIHSTVGIHSAPKGMETISLSEAPDLVIQDTLLNFLRDWQKPPAPAK